MVIFLIRSPLSVIDHVIVFVIVHVDIAGNGVQIVNRIQRRTTAGPVAGNGMGIIQRNVDIQFFIK